MLKKIAQVLLAPAAADVVETGGAGAGIRNFNSAWMKNLGTTPGAPPAAEPTSEPKKEEDDVSPSDEPKPAAGTVGTVGQPAAVAAAKPADKSADKPKPADSKAADVKPEPKPDSKAEGDEEEKMPRTAADWKKFHTNRKEKETKLTAEIESSLGRVKELEAKVQAYEQKLGETPAADPASAEALKQRDQRIEELNQALAVANVERHPDFVKYFEGARSGIVNRAKAIVGEANAAGVEKILKISDPEFRNAQLAEFVAQLDPFTSSRMGVIVEDLVKLDQERGAEVEKALASKTKLESDHKTKSEASRAAFEKTFQAAVGKLQAEKDGFAPFQLRAGDEGWNATVQARIQTAKELIFGGKGATPQKIIQSALDAAAMPVLLASYHATMAAHKEEVATLQAQVQALSAAQPGGRGTGASAGKEEDKDAIPANTPPYKRNQMFAQKMARAMPGPA